MKRHLATAVSLAALAASLAAAAVPAAAQQAVDSNGVPLYTAWQSAWNTGSYDHRHVILGRVSSFTPFRLEVAHKNGDVENIDLKKGTMIEPTGQTPQPGQQIAAIGYYSNGTFVVNRLIIH